MRLCRHGKTPTRCCTQPIVGEGLASVPSLGSPRSETLRQKADLPARKRLPRVRQVFRRSERLHERTTGSYAAGDFTKRKLSIVSPEHRFHCDLSFSV